MAKFTEEYLIGLLKKYDSESLDPILLKFLDERLYFDHKARILLNKGESLGILDKVLDEHEKQRIAGKKYITFSEKNKKKFSVEEDVVLTVKVKNINEIKVKIYELNLEKHYLENSCSEIEDTISLNYLEPTFSFMYENDNSNVYKENIYDIKIEKIQK